MHHRKVAFLATAASLQAPLLRGQPSGSRTNSNRTGEGSTADITRIVPGPQAISAEAQEVPAESLPDTRVTETLAQRSKSTDSPQAQQELP
jgi:hypothetical protein